MFGNFYQYVAYKKAKNFCLRQILPVAQKTLNTPIYLENSPSSVELQSLFIKNMICVTSPQKIMTHL